MAWNADAEWDSSNSEDDDKPLAALIGCGLGKWNVGSESEDSSDSADDHLPLVNWKNHAKKKDKKSNNSQNRMPPRSGREFHLQLLSACQQRGEQRLLRVYVFFGCFFLLCLRSPSVVCVRESGPLILHSFCAALGRKRVLISTRNGSCRKSWRVTSQLCGFIASPS